MEHIIKTHHMNQEEYDTIRGLFDENDSMASLLARIIEEVNHSQAQTYNLAWDKAVRLMGYKDLDSATAEGKRTRINWRTRTIMLLGQPPERGTPEPPQRAEPEIVEPTKEDL